jgi:hypothetical protein
MRVLKWPALTLGLILLVAGTVMVFEAFDRQSHSASDTIRPFLITMAPVWAVAITAALMVLRPRPK